MQNFKNKILEKVKDNGIQITSLRKQVLDIILSNHGIVKAYDVLSELQKDSASIIAPPTVYRTLNFWAEQGVLHKVAAINGYVLCRHVQHECHTSCNAEKDLHQSAFILVCTKCGSVTEKALINEWKALCQALNSHKFKLNEEHIVLTGICNKCC